MVIPSMSEHLKGGLQPQEGIKSPRYFTGGDTVWVRDHRPTTSQKWIQGVVIGAVSYIVDLGGDQRKVHVDHMLRRVPQRVPDKDVHFPKSPNIEPSQLRSKL